MRSSRSRWIVTLALPFWLLAATDASAHRRDEYLQATRISIEPDRLAIELDLTPGIEVAQNILGEIDRNANGVMDEEEATAYATRVLRDLRVELDDRPLQVRLIGSQAASLESVLGGEGALRLTITSALPTLSPGAHQVRYRNEHHADVGAYLANALVPESSRVAVQAQHRDDVQSELTIDFALSPASALVPPLWLLWIIAGGVALTMLVVGRGPARRATRAGAATFARCASVPKSARADFSITFQETTTRVRAALPHRHRQPRRALHPMRSRTDRER